MATTELMERALAFAGRGWAVFPLRPHTKEPFGGTGGVNDATTDPARIRAWWEKWPLANVGIACGPTSGLLVLDVDDEEGRASLAGKPMPRTLAVETGRPGGGTHFYFAHPSFPVKNDSMGQIAGPGLHLKAAGGYVVAAGSIHPTGAVYEWAYGCSPDEVALADCPEWLLEALRPGVDTGKAQTHKSDEIVPIPEGQRNATLTSMAGRLRRVGMDEAEIVAALSVRNRERCRPPLPESEVAKIAASVAQYEPGAPAPESTVGQHPLAKGQTSWTADDLLPADLGEIRWAVPHLLPEGMTILSGQPKAGKSYLALQIARAVATGGDIFGRKVNRGRVLFLSLEDGARRLQRRLREQEWPGGTDTHFELDWPTANAGGLAALAYRLASDDCALCVIDTLGRFMGVAEVKDYGPMTALVGEVQHIAIQTQTAILANHHLNKAKTGDPIIDSLGSTGLAGAADGCYGLYRKPDSRDWLLKMVGRDLEEELELTLRRLPVTKTWGLAADEFGVRAGTLQAKVLDTIDGLGGQATPRQIIAAMADVQTPITKPNLSHELAKLEHKGALVSEKRGRAMVYTHTQQYSQAQRTQQTQPSRGQRV